MTNPPTKLITARLRNGTPVQIEVTSLGGEEDVGFTAAPDFDTVIESVEGIANSAIDILKRVKPKKATIEFGVEIALESGKLTAMLVKGTGKANLKISLEWEGS
jgi:hypothetical protein